ncbi:MAG: hypothetical protein V4629_07310 [Pseudomonadota bacterium]
MQNIMNEIINIKKSRLMSLEIEIQKKKKIRDELSTTIVDMTNKVNAFKIKVTKCRNLMEKSLVRKSRSTFEVLKMRGYYEMRQEQFRVKKSQLDTFNNQLIEYENEIKTMVKNREKLEKKIEVMQELPLEAFAD